MAARRAKGTGSIRTRTLKSGAKRFDVVVPHEGKRVLLEACETREQAHAVLAVWMVDRADHGHFVPRDAEIMTVRQLGHWYLMSRIAALQSTGHGTRASARSAPMRTKRSCRKSETLGRARSRIQPR